MKIILAKLGCGYPHYVTKSQKNKYPFLQGKKYLQANASVYFERDQFYSNKIYTKNELISLSDI